MKRSDKKPLGCGICPYKTNSACHLERHLRIHTGQKPYACSMCSYKATDGGLLKRHMRIHSGEKPFTCQICGHKTAQSCSLKDHMAVHTGKKRYACDICPFQCSRIGRLRDHQLQHKVVTVKKENSSEQSNQPENDTAASPKQTICKCPQCGLEFPGMPNLNRHIATAHSKVSIEPLNPTSHGATAELPYHCSLCSASADTLETLNTHFTRHILYRCLECDATYESATELIAHGPDHLEELIFSCSKCDFKSKTRNELRGHERIHTSSQSLICTECDFVSKSSTEFAQHLQTHTTKEMVQCNICSTKFAKTTELREHMAIHYSRSRARMTKKPTVIAPELSNIGSFHCYYCSYKCSEENQMAKHIQEVHITLSVSSEPHSSKDCDKENEIYSHKTEEPDGSSHTDEAKAVIPNDVLHVPTKKAQSDSCTKSNFGHGLQTHKVLECTHCPCSSYGFRWLRNLECHYRPLTHFMNPNDTDLSGFPPFHSGRCSSCFMQDPHQHAKVPTDDCKEIATFPHFPVTHTNHNALHAHETGVETCSPQNAQSAPGCIQTSATDSSPDNDGVRECPPNSNFKRSRDAQTKSANCDIDQMATETEPNMKKLRKENEQKNNNVTIHETYNFENEGKPGNLKCGNRKSDEDRSKSAEILLSKLRQFFSESFPKISCPSEEDSDQSTLTANTSTQDIMTIELSSDSNASDRSY